MRSAREGVRRTVFGPFEAIDFPGEGPVVVLFHGYGADAADLAPLALEVPASARWILPDAPRSSGEAAFSIGRAWFPIDVARLEEAQRAGVEWDLSGEEPAGLADARREAFDFLGALSVPWARLVLGGFSQGAILAADLALRAPEAPAGVVLLSGNLVSEAAWRALAPRRAGLRFFQSHGIADPILGYKGARRLEGLLRGAGWDGSLLAFEGGHGIPPEVVAALGRFLDSLKPASS